VSHPWPKIDNSHERAEGGIPESSSDLAERPPELVLHDHLRLRKLNAVELDISRNYSRDVVLLSGEGTFRGHDGIRNSARLLAERLPDASFDYITIRLERNLGFLEWTAVARNVTVNDGTDSFLIRDGEILVQTVHYTIEGAAAASKWGMRAIGLLCMGVGTSLIACRPRRRVASERSVMPDRGRLGQSKTA
jgi:hypothetical protein